MTAFAKAALVMCLLTATLPAGATPATPLGKGEREGWTWTLIHPEMVALGGGGLDADDVRYIHEQGFRAILNYRAEHPDDEQTVRALGMKYLLIPETYAEEDTMLLEDVQKAVDFIEANLARGDPVYVHCTGGWHRSAAGVVAYYMKSRGWRFQEAWDHVAKVRPGIEPRYADALLAYEAHLAGEPKLTVDIWTERWDVAVGDTVNLTAYVSHHGKPVAGSVVRYAMDHGPGVQTATTGPEGLAVFRFEAPEVGLMQYVHVKAEKEGFVAGYDRNVYWVKGSRPAPPTELVLSNETIRIQPNATVTIPVKVLEQGRPSNARITVTSDCGTHFRAYTGWDGEVDVTFQAPAREGQYEFLMHVNRFPAEPVVRQIRVAVGEGETASCDGTAAGASPGTLDPPKELQAIPSVALPGVIAALLLAWRACERGSGHRPHPKETRSA